MKNVISILIASALLLGGTVNASDEAIFQEDFAGPEIDNTWSWVRESPSGWKLGDGVLQLLTNGDLWEARNTQQNLLLRPAPTVSSMSYAAEVKVSNRSDLTERYEHGGLIWYVDDDNWVTLTQLNHVVDKTQKIMLVHETEGDGRAGDSHAVPYTPSRVELRLVVEGAKFTGYYRETAASAWSLLGSIAFAEESAEMKGAAPKIGLTAGSNPSKTGHWVTFDEFGLSRLD